jgi:hypothetical protein
MRGDGWPQLKAGGGPREVPLHSSRGRENRYVHWIVKETEQRKKLTRAASGGVLDLEESLGVSGHDCG